MPENERGWIKWVIGAFVFGALAGFLTTSLLKIIIVNERLKALTGLVTPAFIIIALAIVLFLYTKDKEKTL